MSFGPEPFRPPAGGSGTVDYRLARNSVVAEYHRGRLSRLDVCDAHPELLRAATNLGHATEEDCPICDDACLVWVTYVFGSRLPPSGRCVSSAAELAKLDRSPRDLAGYVVEVCPECNWNHLIRQFSLGRRR